MKDIADIPLAVQWHNGMLPGPQHFQQAFNRQEGLIKHHTRNTTPFYWGIKRLEISKTMLVSGVFKVEKLRAIMPDLTEISLDDDERNKLSIELSEYKEEIKKQGLTVWLVIPARKASSAGGKGELPRYLFDPGDLVPDEFTGENPRQIPRLRPAVELAIVEILPSKYVGFPLAKITFKDANYALTDYIPPGISIEAAQPVKEISAGIVKQLREKANFLSEKARASSSATGLSMILETKDKIRSVVSSLPQFETVLAVKESHPFTLYQSLAMLVGSVAALDQGFIPPVLRPYDHNNLMEIFQDVKDYIFRVTEQGIQEKYTTYSFDYDNQEYHYCATIRKEWGTDEIIIGVRGQPGMSNREIIDWMEKCVIGSESVFPSMLERRVSGVKRKPIEGNEYLVPLRGVQLFSLKFNSDFIKLDEQLMIYNSADRVESSNQADEIVLYVENKNVGES